MLIPRKIKETIYSLKNPNRIMNTEQTSKNIFTYKYTYNKKYTYINNPVFVFVVILSSLIMYAKLESISECRQSLLSSPE